MVPRRSRARIRKRAVQSRVWLLQWPGRVEGLCAGVQMVGNLQGQGGTRRWDL